VIVTHAGRGAGYLIVHPKAGARIHSTAPRFRRNR